MKNHHVIFLVTVMLLFLFMQILHPVGPANYLFMVFAAYVVLSSIDGNAVKVNWWCVGLILAAALSILCNTVMAFFKPWPRLALFVMMMIGCSPMLRGDSIDRYRRQIVQGGLWSMAVVTVVSLLGYVLGFGQYIEGYVNGYMGVVGHPNFLGFFAMIAQVCFAALFFRCTERWERYLFIGLWLSSFVILLLTASRSATACGMVGSMLAAYLRLRQNSTALMRILLTVFVLLIVAWPIIAPYTETMQKKEMSFDDGGEAMVVATRGSIWELRYQEIEESPIVGVGAYSCDISLENAEVFYDVENGSIELGSSYLGLFSQLGIVGVLIFFFFLVPIAWKSFVYATRWRTPYAQLIFPLLFVCCLHMMFEGYLMTAGTVQCIVVWMIISAADQCDKVADYPITWEEFDPLTPEMYAYYSGNSQDA